MRISISIYKIETITPERETFVFDPKPEIFEHIRLDNVPNIVYNVLRTRIECGYCFVLDR